MSRKREIVFPVLDVDGFELCPQCKGTGVCAYCKGTGDHSIFSVQRWNCQDGKCKVCKGSGWI
jgi:hypothetical protein